MLLLVVVVMLLLLLLEMTIKVAMTTFTTHTMNTSTMTIHRAAKRWRPRKWRTSSGGTRGPGW